MNIRAFYGYDRFLIASIYSAAILSSSYTFDFDFFEIFPMKAKATQSTAATASAATKILALGMKEVVPSLPTMVSALASTVLPIQGPTTPGMST